MKKRLRLRRELCFVLGAVVMFLVTLFMNSAIEDYNEYLKRCDERKGYTCNVFAR